MKKRVSDDRNRKGPGGVDSVRPDARQLDEIGAILAKKGLITSKQLEEAKAEQSTTGNGIREILLARGTVTEEDFYRALAERTGWHYWSFQQGGIDRQASQAIPKRFAEKHKVLPLQWDKRRLEVALSEPEDLAVVDLLRRLGKQSGQELQFRVASPTSMHQGTAYAYSVDLEIEPLPEARFSEPGKERADLVGNPETPRIRKIFNELLHQAVVEGASDIHLENLERRVRVRFRVDGMLQVRKTPVTKENIGQVLSILKIDSGLDITERRRPQDGVLRKRIGENWLVDFRVHLHCSQFGGDAVIRILDTTRKLPRLEQLGIAPSLLESYLRLVSQPQGLILITGPTGSGKSTTLYSTLSLLNVPERKIVTAEDPVEYHLDGICQYQVNDFIGNSFSEYARRFLRKDPDVILIGETRDETTAAACLRAAMTGHLVFSTLHTNQTTACVSRLRDLGVDASSMCDALLAVLAQRLVRKNCVHCLQGCAPNLEILRGFGVATVEETTVGGFARGVGCAHCSLTGYSGRIGIFELWEPDERARRAILSGADQWSLFRMARESGVLPLLDDGLAKARAGLTTLEEVRRVIPPPPGQLECTGLSSGRR